MFKDDLELALAARAGVESLGLEPSAEHDALFLDYFNEAFGLRLNGTEPIRWIEIRNEILYEQFRDQRNIVRVLHVPTETRKTLYFAAPDGGWGTVEW